MKLKQGRRHFHVAFSACCAIKLKNHCLGLLIPPDHLNLYDVTDFLEKKTLNARVPYPRVLREQFCRVSCFSFSQSLLGDSLDCQGNTAPLVTCPVDLTSHPQRKKPFRKKNYSRGLEKCCQTPSRGAQGDDDNDDDNHNVTVRVVENCSFRVFSATTISHHFNIPKMSSIFLVVVSASTYIFIGNLISLSSLLSLLSLRNFCITSPRFPQRNVCLFH